MIFRPHILGLALSCPGLGCAVAPTIPAPRPAPIEVSVAASMGGDGAYHAVVGQWVELPWLRFGVVRTISCKTLVEGDRSLGLELLVENLAQVDAKGVERITVEDAAGSVMHPSV